MPAKNIKASDVVGLIRVALRRYDSVCTYDVTSELGEEGEEQVILTTVDETDTKQVWVISEKGIWETDPPLEETDDSTEPV